MSTLILNQLADHHKALNPVDADSLNAAAAADVERFLTHRGEVKPTPLVCMPALAAQLGVRSIHIKDEGFRLGLGSFKALGGGYAVTRLVLEAAARLLERPVDFGELQHPQVCAVAERITFGCATDGNHGRAVAQGAQLVGAKAAVFVHSGVSEERIAAIACFGAEIFRVRGAYDDAVVEAARVCDAKGWTLVSDTSCPGYERIPRLVMQGYTALARDSLAALPEPPSHVFAQAGVGGIAAAVGGHFALVLGGMRPTFVVVEPARAACLFQSARAGHRVKIEPGLPTVMAMLECYEPSLVAWRVLSRVADAFLTVDDNEAIAVMNRLARPAGNDPVIVAGESGGVGLAGLIKVAGDADMRNRIGLGSDSRIFLINTEGATDPGRYRELVGLDLDCNRGK